MLHHSVLHHSVHHALECRQRLIGTLLTFSWIFFWQYRHIVLSELIFAVQYRHIVLSELIFALQYRHIMLPELIFALQYRNIVLSEPKPRPSRLENVGNACPRQDLYTPKGGAS